MIIVLLYYKIMCYNIDVYDNFFNRIVLLVDGIICFINNY